MLHQWFRDMSAYMCQCHYLQEYRDAAGLEVASTAQIMEYMEDAAVEYHWEWLHLEPAERALMQLSGIPVPGPTTLRMHSATQLFFDQIWRSIFAHMPDDIVRRYSTR